MVESRESLIKCCAEETTNIQEMMKYIEMWNYNGRILSDISYNITQANYFTILIYLHRCSFRELLESSKTY